MPDEIVRRAKANYAYATNLPKFDVAPGRWDDTKGHIDKTIKGIISGASFAGHQMAEH